MRKFFTFTFIFVLGLSLVSYAKPGKNGKFSAKPFVVDPDDTDLLVSGWVTHQGLPDAGKSNHALYLQKADLTSNLGFAAAKIKSFKDRAVTDLTELGFDYKNGGHCTAGSPRFVVRVDGVDYSLACAFGLASTSPDDPINWTRVRFSGPEFSAAGIPLVGIVESVQLVFDEGTDLGSGTVYLDNLDINTVLIGKPGKGGPKK